MRGQAAQPGRHSQGAGGRARGQEVRGAVLAAGVLAAAVVAAYLLGTLDSAPEHIGQSPASIPQEGIGAPGGDLPLATREVDLPASQPAGRDRVTSLEVRDGWGHPQPGMALRLTPPDHRNAALELVANAEGMLDLAGLVPEPGGDAVFSAVNAEWIVVTGTLADASALGHLLVCPRVRITGVVRLAGISPEEAAQLLADLQFVVLALPELSYAALNDRIRIHRALARRWPTARPLALSRCIPTRWPRSSRARARVTGARVAADPKHLGPAGRGCAADVERRDDAGDRQALWRIDRDRVHARAGSCAGIAARGRLFVDRRARPAGGARQ